MGQRWGSDEPARAFFRFIFSAVVLYYEGCLFLYFTIHRKGLVMDKVRVGFIGCGGGLGANFFFFNIPHGGGEEREGGFSGGSLVGPKKNR